MNWMNVLFSVMLTLITAAFKLFEEQYRLHEDGTAEESIPRSMNPGFCWGGWDGMLERLLQVAQDHGENAMIFWRSSIMSKFVVIQNIMSTLWKIMKCYWRVIVMQLAGGFDVTAKIAWTYAVKGFITWGVSSHQQGNALFDRTLLLWAVSLTFVFSALMLLLQRCRRCVEHWRKEFYADGAEEKNELANKSLKAGLTAGLVAGLATGLAVGRTDGLDAGLAFGFAVGPAAGLATGLAIGLDWHTLCKNYLLLIEDTLGWVVGCAWTDALVAYTPLGENTIERPWVAAEDVVAAPIFTALGVLWFVSTGQAAAPPKLAHQHSDHARAHAEAAFATSAFSFFVGWSWVVVLRAGTALVFDAVELLSAAGDFLVASLVASLNDSETVSSSNKTLGEQAVLGFFLRGSSIVSVCLLGPGLTVAALWAGMCHKAVMCRLGRAPQGSPRRPP